MNIFSYDAGAYEFGYEVGPDGQFHHETRGPDGVVYGCYGYIDPNGDLRVYHYVSDGWGKSLRKSGKWTQKSKTKITVFILFKIYT